MKHLITKCDKEGTDQFEALMEQRNTPRQDSGLSPCEMMYGKSTRTSFNPIRTEIRNENNERSL